MYARISDNKKFSLQWTLSAYTYGFTHKCRQRYLVLYTTVFLDITITLAAVPFVAACVLNASSGLMRVWSHWELIGRFILDLSSIVVHVCSYTLLALLVVRYTKSQKPQRSTVIFRNITTMFNTWEKTRMMLRSSALICLRIKVYAFV